MEHFRKSLATSQTGCEFLTFMTLSCCNWRPCVISPSAGATLARLLSPRIQRAPSSSPLLWGPAYSLAPTGKGVQLRLGVAGP